MSSPSPKIRLQAPRRHLLTALALIYLAFQGLFHLHEIEHLSQGDNEAHCALCMQGATPTLPSLAALAVRPLPSAPENGATPRPEVRVAGVAGVHRPRAPPPAI